MLHVGGLLATVGVIVQLRLMVPVNPFAGVRLIVDVFPVVAPGATLTAVPAMEKLGGGMLMVYAAETTLLEV